MRATTLRVAPTKLSSTAIGFARVGGAVDLDPAAGERALEIDPGAHGIAGAVEDGHGGVALEGLADAAPTVGFDGAVDDEEVFGEQPRRGVGELLPQPGRPDDVGAEEGDDAGRQRFAVPSGAQLLDQLAGGRRALGGSVASPRRRARSS